MTTENVMKLGKTERLSFSFVLLSFLHIYRPWTFETMQTADFADVLHHQKKKKRKIIKNQFELNSEKCIKMRISGPKIHIKLSVISR